MAHASQPWRRSSTVPWRCYLVAASIFALGAASGCREIHGNERLALAAETFSRTADECLYDVRDRGFKYETSPNCTALGSVSRAFIEAGGDLPGAPCNYRLVGAQALTVAWSARATSAGNKKFMTLW